VPDIGNETQSETVTETVTVTQAEIGRSGVTVSASVRRGEEGGKGGGGEKHSCFQHVSASAKKKSNDVDVAHSPGGDALSQKSMTREERRKAMPECSAFVDDIRENFGEPTYIHARENGHEIEWGTRRD
jgi:hypothetical protein